MESWVLDDIDDKFNYFKDQKYNKKNTVDKGVIEINIT